MSCENLKGSEAVNFRDRGDRSLEIWLATAASMGKGSLLKNVRAEPFGNTAPVAWLGQAGAAELDLDAKAVLRIMRYPWWALGACMGLAARSGL